MGLKKKKKQCLSPESLQVRSPLRLTDEQHRVQGPGVKQSHTHQVSDRRGLAVLAPSLFLLPYASLINGPSVHVSFLELETHFYFWFARIGCYLIWVLNRYMGSLLSRIPQWLSGKESACNAGDEGSVPGSGRSLGERNGNPLHYVCLGNPMDRGAWWATV